MWSLNQSLRYLIWGWKLSSFLKSLLWPSYRSHAIYSHKCKLSCSSFCCHIYASRPTLNSFHELPFTFHFLYACTRNHWQLNHDVSRVRRDRSLLLSSHWLLISSSRRSQKCTKSNFSQSCKWWYASLRSTLNLIQYRNSWIWFNPFKFSPNCFCFPWPFHFNWSYG